MTKSNLLAGIGLGLVLAFAGVGSASAAKLQDGVWLQSGGQTVLFTSTDELHEAFTSLQAFVTPTGFTDGTVYMGRPGEHELFGAYSDAFTLVSTNGHVDAYFISDGASAQEQSAFVHVPNQWQDVSGFFGQPDGFARILSDVPEPATWAMMLVGFGAIGATLRSSRRRTASLA
jgi:hypothetical protein